MWVSARSDVREEERNKGKRRELGKMEEGGEVRRLYHQRKMRKGEGRENGMKEEAGGSEDKCLDERD